MRLRLAAIEGRRRGATRRQGREGHALRAGEGRRDRRPRANEHDPARLRDGRDQGTGNTLANPLYREGNALKTFDYSRRQSSLQRQAVDARASIAEERSVAALSTIWRSARPSRATTPISSTSSASIKPAGKGALHLAACVLFRGNVEAAIAKKSSSQRGVIKGIIGLPANLFYGTGIPACVVVIDKEGANARKAYLHGRRLEGLHQGRQQEPPARARHPQDRRHVHASKPSPALLAPRAGPVKSRTRRTTTTSICRATSTALNPRICRTSTRICAVASRTATSTRSNATGGSFPGVRAAIFAKADHAGYLQLKLPTDEVKSAILDHAEFRTFNNFVTKLFAKWKKAAEPRQGLREGRASEGADRKRRGRLTSDLQGRAAARRLRRVPTPHG